MPAYFGYPARPGSKISESLKSKGILLLRAVPSEFHVLGVPETIHSFYAVMISYLCYIICAIWKNRVQAVDPESDLSLPGSAATIEFLPFECPPLSISFASTSEITEKFLRDHGFVMQQAQQTTIYTRTEATDIDLLRKVLRLPGIIKTTRSPWGFVNVQAATGFFQIVKYLSLLQTAFQLSCFPDSAEEMAYKTGEKRKRQEPTLVATLGEPLVIGDTVLVDEEGSSGNLGMIIRSNAQASSPFTVGKSFIVTGHPRQNIGFSKDDLLTTARNKHGLVFPYEEDLSRVDRIGPLSLIQKHCFKNFGRTFRERVETLDALKSAWGVIKKNSVSHALSHFAKTVELAIECQAAALPVFSNGHHYEGVALIGTSFRIHINGSEMVSLTGTALSAEIQSLSNHENALSKILEILGGKVDEDEKTDIDSIFRLREVVLSHKTVLTAQDISAIKDLAYQLRFKMSCWSLQPRNLIKALGIIANSDQLSSDCPIAPHTIDNENMVETVLSCFGKSCPSFMVPNGRKLSLLSAMPSQRTVPVARRTGQRGIVQVVQHSQDQTVQVRAVDYETAVYDFNLMKTEKAIRVIPVADANNSADVSVFYRENRAEMWAKLRAIMNTEETQVGVALDRLEQIAQEGSSSGEPKTDAFDDMYVLYNIPIRTRTDHSLIAENDSVDWLEFTGWDEVGDFSYLSYTLLPAWRCSFPLSYVPRCIPVFELSFDDRLLERYLLEDIDISMARLVVE